MIVSVITCRCGWGAALTRVRATLLCPKLCPRLCPKHYPNSPLTAKLSGAGTPKTLVVQGRPCHTPHFESAVSANSTTRPCGQFHTSSADECNRRRAGAFNRTGSVPAPDCRRDSPYDTVRRRRRTATIPAVAKPAANNSNPAGPAAGTGEVTGQAIARSARSDSAQVLPATGGSQISWSRPARRSADRLPEPARR